MNGKLSLCFLFLFLTSCSTTKNWQSKQDSSMFLASFDEFNGQEKIKFETKKNSVLYLTYSIQKESGGFSININNQNLLINSLKISHQKYKLDNPISLFIEGNHAKGSFKLSYPILNNKEIVVESNKNFELLCLAYFLTNMYHDIKENVGTLTLNGNNINIKDWYKLNILIGSSFKAHLDSENLKALSRFFDKKWFLDYSKYVIKLDDFPNAKSINPEPFDNLFKSKQENEDFINALNELFTEIDFDLYFKRFNTYYSQMIKEVKNNLPSSSFITEMEHLYNKKFNRYFLNPSLTMPTSMGFGISFDADKSIGQVFGAFETPKNISNIDSLHLGYSNSKSIRNLSVHEFGHSFVNPIIDSIPETIINSKKQLFNPIKSRLSNQGYTNWKIALYEHYVRAGEIIIAEILNDTETAKQLENDYINNKHFIYLKQILPKFRHWYHYEFLDKTYKTFVLESINALHGDF